MTTTLSCVAPTTHFQSLGYDITQAGTPVADVDVPKVLSAAAHSGVIIGAGAGGTPGVVPASSFYNYATGAPAYGTYNIGASCIDSAGAEWVCTAGGSPGTWASSGAGNSLPTQSGNSGKFLTTDGTATSWGTVTGAVTSVATKTGAVTLVKADVGLGSVDNTADTAKPVSTAQAAADALRAPTSRQIISGTALTGGGDLTADRTLAVDFATSGVVSSTKAVRSDDIRLPDVYGSTQMLGWYAGVGGRATAPVDVLFLGDSISEGQGSSVIGDRWITRTVAALRTAYQPSGVTGGDGYIPGFYKITSPVPATAGFTTGGAPTQNTTYGLGRRAISLGSGDSVSITRTFTSCKIFYASTGTSASFTWKYGAGSTTTVTVSGTAGEYTASTTGQAAASTLLTLTRVTGTCVIEGVMFFNGDESTGVRLWDGAKFGTYTSQYANSPLNWMDPITTIAPNLIVSAWGTNDFAQYDAATFGTNTQTLITNLRTKAPNASILLVGMWPRTSGAFGSDVWAAYMAQLAALAVSNSGVMFLDLTRRLPALGATDTYSLMFDTLHPNSKGHQVVADMVAFALTRR